MVSSAILPVQSAVLLCLARKKIVLRPARPTVDNGLSDRVRRARTSAPSDTPPRYKSPPRLLLSPALPSTTPRQSTAHRHRHRHGHGHHLPPARPPPPPVALRGREHRLGAWRRRGRRRRRRRGRGRWGRRGEAGPAGAGAGGGEAVVPGAGVRGHAGRRRVPLLHALERGVPGAGHAVRRRGLPRHRHDALPQRRQRDLRRPPPAIRLPLRLHARLRRLPAHHARRVRHLPRRRARPHRARRHLRRPRNRRRARGGQAEQHKWQRLRTTNNGRARAVDGRPLDGVHAAQRQHPRRQHTAHRRALLPLRLRGHRHRSRRDESRRVEGAMDHQPAQDLRGDRHGHRAAPDAPQPAPALLLRLRIRLRRLQPPWRRHRHHHRRHHAGHCGGLDLRHIHGPCHRHLHLRLHQPPPLQGVHAPEARRRGHAHRPVARRRAWHRGHRRGHDMGHLIVRVAWDGMICWFWTFVHILHSGRIL